MAERASADSAAWLTRNYGDACPDCGRPVSVWEQVCFGPDTHNTYHCSWCSWTGRTPKIVVWCRNEWPDYEPQWPMEPPHPIACSCVGRGYYPPEDAPHSDGIGGGQ